MIKQKFSFEISSYILKKNDQNQRKYWVGSLLWPIGPLLALLFVNDLILGNWQNGIRMGRGYYILFQFWCLLTWSRNLLWSKCVRRKYVLCPPCKEVRTKKILWNYTSGQVQLQHCKGRVQSMINYPILKLTNFAIFQFWFRVSYKTLA